MIYSGISHQTPIKQKRDQVSQTSIETRNGWPFRLQSFVFNRLLLNEAEIYEAVGESVRLTALITLLASLVLVHLHLWFV